MRTKPSGLLRPCLPCGSRPDTSHIPVEEIANHVKAIQSILDNEEDKYVDEYAIAAAMRDYEATYLNPSPEVYSAVFDSLAKQKIITKARFKEYLKLLPPSENEAGTRG